LSVHFGKILGFNCTENRHLQTHNSELVF
jgi:hypothetical protein